MSSIQIATRREFLTRGLGLVGVGAALPNFLINSALAAPPANTRDRIVVALAQIGGHDGLSDVPPYGHDEYYRYRRATRITREEVIRLNNEVGLHPNLRGFREMLDQRSFAVVLGTGYPQYNLSHFVARDYWEAGRSGQTTGRPGAVGWLGRYLDHAFRGVRDPKLGLAVGPGRLPLIVTGQEHPGVGFSSPESFRFNGERSERGLALYQRLNRTSPAPSGDDLQFVTQTAVNANESSQVILDMVNNYQTDVTYPDTEFGAALRTIAGCIGQGLSTRAYYAAQGIAVFGGYDTHAEQRPRHDRLMTELCDSVCAFYRDLRRQGNADRVLTFTFSEFGRRVPENYSGGTDHGLGQPMFLFGPMVRPGVHGTQPSLSDLDENNNLKVTVDFRRVYAAILDRWLGTSHEQILGARYPLIDCIAG
ncbi:MAG: DUF1501 domain-containing protein [Gemmataceae bacterium]|nr:DUF1501 domain-containing protein [Gemmataceae bacterium]